MQRLYTTLIALIATISMMAQGWPSNYPGVMLQGFYWDSYADTKWTVLESQADELSQYFDLIWVPQSGYCNTLTMQMGYLPIWWFDHKSAFGTEAELRSMIKTFKDKGTGIIEDVVINHRNGNTNWCDFPTETWKGQTMTWSLADICKTDECSKNGYSPTGAAETNLSETDFNGGRDLDHTSTHVQENVKIYLDFLLNDLGYTGFRYDMVKGYDPKYTGMYNVSAKPKFSVGEYWDGNLTRVTGWIDGTKVDGIIQSAAFDFPMKYKINSAFGGRQWGKLAEAMLATKNGYSRYAITFVDNHDTYREGAKLHYNVCAANAYILTMPGTPCLFLPHWKAYKGTLKRLITLRKLAGINNESQIITANVSGNGFVLSVKGDNATLLLLLGNPDIVVTADQQLALEGNNYRIYTSASVDLSSVKAITETDQEQEVTTVPDFCKVNEGETCAFFEVPAYWGMTGGQVVKCWRWDHQYNYTTNSWPGTACIRVGTAANGNAVWKWTFKESDKKNQSSSNEGIIFNNGINGGDAARQTEDLPFENAGYYTTNGAWRNVLTDATGISGVKADSGKSSDKVYTIDGRLVSTSGAVDNLQKGVYIMKGKKYILK